MHLRTLSLENIRHVQSLFPTTEKLLAAADYYLQLIETARDDPVYWPKKDLDAAIQVLQAAATVRAGGPASFKWIDPDEELRPEKPLNRMELALFQARTIAIKTRTIP